MSHPSSREIADNNQHQIDEALGEYNRYFANRHYGRVATDNECLVYYINNGGAEGHRQRMREKSWYFILMRSLAAFWQRCRDYVTRKFQRLIAVL